MPEPAEPAQPAAPSPGRAPPNPPEALVTGVLDLSELDALLSAPTLEPEAPSGAMPTVDSERSALARLEDLGDALERHRERRPGDEPRRPPVPAAPAGAATGRGPRSLLRSNLVVAAGTTLSRLTGLARVVVFGYVIGKEALADAYLIGNETPNIVYELLLGGVLSATLVPLFTSFLESDEDDGGREATNVVLTLTLSALAVITAIASLAAPAVFGLYTINTEGDVDPRLLREVGTQLTRVFLLQIFFYGAAGLLNAYLNSRRRFFAAAWSPIVANVVIIATLLSLPRQTWELADVLTNDRLRLTLALGSTAAIAVMALLLVPAARRAGLSFRPTFQIRHPAVRRLVAMSVWTFGYVVANQVVIVVVRNLSGPGSGDSAAYFQAYTFFVLPHGLLAMSIATTFVPEMARAVARRDRGAFIARTSLGVRIIALLTLPASVLLFVLRRPLIGVLLQHGEYGPEDALVTSRALAGFSLGLVGFSVYLFTLRGFYAHQDTRTPFVINAGQCVMNIAFAALFVGRWGVLGLGAAFALSYLLAAAWALRILSYKVRGFAFHSVVGSVARMAVAGALAGEAAWLVADHVGANSGAGALGRVLAGSAVVVAVYAGVLVLQRAPELAALRGVTRRRV